MRLLYYLYWKDFAEFFDGSGLRVDVRLYMRVIAEKVGQGGVEYSQRLNERIATLLVAFKTKTTTYFMCPTSLAQ